MSHGCNIVGGSYFTGWPSYAVDAPAMSHRIIEWLTFRYRIGGELYYDTVEAYAAGKDPWRDQLLFGGNGDGTLFYPGRARELGGKSDFPVESIRLALIREGLEDYEYLKLYARVAGDREAQALAATIAGKTYQWEHDPERLYAARKKMAEAIDQASRPSRRRGAGAAPRRRQKRRARAAVSRARPHQRARFSNTLVACCRLMNGHVESAHSGSGEMRAAPHRAARPLASGSRIGVTVAECEPCPGCCC